MLGSLPSRETAQHGCEMSDLNRNAAKERLEPMKDVEYNILPQNIGVKQQMGNKLLRLIEPRTGIGSRRKIFSDAALMQVIVPLFFEQLLTMTAGIADTFMISCAGDTAVSGVSLVNMFVTIFIYLFTALAAGGAVVVSQYIGSGNRENADCSAGQLLTSAAVISIALMGAALIWNRQLLQFLFRRIEPDVMRACMTCLVLRRFPSRPLPSITRAPPCAGA